jgi:hypothetical protein
MSTCLVWVAVPSVGRGKSSQIFLYHQLRLCTVEGSTSLFKHFGFITSPLSSTSSSTIQLLFGVTIKVLSSSTKTQCNNNGPNTLKSICITSKSRYMTGSSIHNTVHPLNRLQTSSPRHLLSRSSTSYAIVLELMSQLISNCFCPFFIFLCIVL